MWSCSWRLDLITHGHAHWEVNCWHQGTDASTRPHSSRLSHKSLRRRLTDEVSIIATGGIIPPMSVHSTYWSNRIEELYSILNTVLSTSTWLTIEATGKACSKCNFYQLCFWGVAGYYTGNSEVKLLKGSQ